MYCTYILLNFTLGMFFYNKKPHAFQVLFLSIQCSIMSLMVTCWAELWPLRSLSRAQLCNFRSVCVTKTFRRPVMGRGKKKVWPRVQFTGHFPAVVSLFVANSHWVIVFQELLCPWRTSITFIEVVSMRTLSLIPGPTKACHPSVTVVAY